MKNYIYLFLMLYTFKLFPQDSGWEDKGDYLLQKMETPAVIQAKVTGNGKHLFTFHQDKKLRKWDNATGVLLYQWQFDQETIAADVDNKGERVYTAKNFRPLIINNHNLDTFAVDIYSTKLAVFNASKVGTILMPLVGFHNDFPEPALKVIRIPADSLLIFTIEHIHYDGRKDDYSLKYVIEKDTIASFIGNVIYSADNRLVAMNKAFPDLSYGIYFFSDRDYYGAISTYIPKDNTFETLFEYFIHPKASGEFIGSKFRFLSSGYSKTNSEIVTYSVFHMKNEHIFTAHDIDKPGPPVILPCDFSLNNWTVAAKDLLVSMDTSKNEINFDFINYKYNYHLSSFACPEINKRYSFYNNSNGNIIYYPISGNGRFVRIIPRTDKLHANFKTNAEIYYTGEEISFDNGSNGNITEYSWDFGSGNISHEKSPLYSFTSPGVYTIRLTVEDNSGNKSHFSKELEIIDKYIPEFSVSATEIFAGDSIELTINHYDSDFAYNLYGTYSTTALQADRTFLKFENPGFYGIGISASKGTKADSADPMAYVTVHSRRKANDYLLFDLYLRDSNRIGNITDIVETDKHYFVLNNKFISKPRDPYGDPRGAADAFNFCYAIDKTTDKISSIETNRKFTWNMTLGAYMANGELFKVSPEMVLFREGRIIDVPNITGSDYDYYLINDKLEIDTLSAAEPRYGSYYYLGLSDDNRLLFTEDNTAYPFHTVRAYDIQKRAWQTLGLFSERISFFYKNHVYFTNELYDIKKMSLDGTLLGSSSLRSKLPEIKKAYLLKEYENILVFHENKYSWVSMDDFSVTETHELNGDLDLDFKDFDCNGKYAIGLKKNEIYVMTLPGMVLKSKITFGDRPETIHNIKLAQDNNILVGAGSTMTLWTIDPEGTATSIFYKLSMQKILDASTAVKEIRIAVPELLIYPNPAKDIITVSSIPSQGNISLADATGNILKELALLPGEPLDIDVSSFPPGAYYLVYDFGSGIRTYHLSLAR